MSGIPLIKRPLRMEHRHQSAPLVSHSVALKPKDLDQASLSANSGMRTGWPERESATDMSALIPLMLDSTLCSEIAG